MPTNALVAFPVGTILSIEQAGLGAVTVTAISGVTIRSLPTTADQYDVIQIVKVDTDEWVVIGGVA